MTSLPSYSALFLLYLSFPILVIVYRRLTASEERSVRAFTLNINWEVELIQDFTNQIRVGWGSLEQTNDRVLLNNTRTVVFR